MMDKNHMTMQFSLLDAKKYVTKFNVFIIKTLKTIGIQGLYLNTIKAIYDNQKLTSYSTTVKS
jgi:hypothetical protein